MFIDSTKVDGTSRWVALDDLTMALATAHRERIAERLTVVGLAITA